jgi:type IV pilus assembly protein PilA
MVLKQRLKKNRKRGFTLVEVIVVLVILAILAAVAIPALTGYIDDANKKAVISQTRSAVVAAQTLVSNAYGEGADISNQTTLEDEIVTIGGIQRLSGDTSIVSIAAITLTGSAIQTIEVGTKSGKSGQYDIRKTPPYSVIN